MVQTLCAMLSRGGCDGSGTVSVVRGVLAGSDRSVDVEYECSGILGSGAHGHVYAGVLKRPIERTVAIKAVRGSGAMREVGYLLACQHEHVVEFYGHWTGTFGRVYIAMERVCLNAKEAIVECDDVAVSDVVRYSRHLISAVSYVHDRRVCHRDVKPQNCLVDVGTGTLKLCDFGLAVRVGSCGGTYGSFYVCSRYYRAPELWVQRRHGSGVYTVGIDVWSVGCVIAEFFLKEPVFRKCPIAPYDVCCSALIARGAPECVVACVRGCLRGDAGAREMMMPLCAIKQ